MSYFGFLIRFVIPPILILLVLTFWDKRKQAPNFRDGRAVWIAIGIHILLAVLYTTPWDNYLVATKVWYYNPKLVTGLIIGYVPIEEYSFFVLETILAGLWWWFLVRRFTLTPSPYPKGHTSPAGRGEFLPNNTLVYVSTCLLISIWLVFAYLFFLGAEKWTYLSITLFWALPAILPQLLFGADILWHYRKLVFWGIVIPGIYLSLIDIVALRATIWSISPVQTTGVLFFGTLPLEEVVFFFITNILITFGTTLPLSNVSEGRFTEIKKQVESWKAKRMVNPQQR